MVATPPAKSEAVISNPIVARIEAGRLADDQGDGDDAAVHRQDVLKAIGEIGGDAQPRIFWSTRFASCCLRSLARSSLSLPPDVCPCVRGGFTKHARENEHLPAARADFKRFREPRREFWPGNNAIAT